MSKPYRLQIFVFEHPNVQKAAWVRADTIVEAAPILFAGTGIPVVVQNDYGWVLFNPEQRQHRRGEKRPLSRWEFMTGVSGPADLKGMPEYVEALRNLRCPRKQGELRIGEEYPRSSLIELRQIPASAIIETRLNRSGLREPWNIRADQIMGFAERDASPVEKMGTALVVLSENQEATEIGSRMPLFQTGDMVHLIAKDNGEDKIVFAQVVRLAVIVRVVDIAGG
jgi:hypothetical protein